MIRLMMIRAAALVALLTLPVPVMAQVDWSILDGTTGSTTCPEGQTERRPSLLIFGTPDASSVQVTTASIAPGFIPGQGFTGNNLRLSVYLSVVENGQTRVGSPVQLASSSLSDIAQQTRTLNNLKAGTRYTAVISLGTNVAENVLARSCFRTAPDLEIPLGSGRGGAGPGDSWSSGCYAFSKDPNQIRACLCGARNADGNWARTDAEDGYEYIRDAAWRQNVGCVTN